MVGKTSIRLKSIPEKPDGTVPLPISKSLSNRALVLEHQTEANLLGSNTSNANDTLLLKQLIDRIDQSDTIDVEDAGTVARFLLALCATKSGKTYKLHGSKRMHERPINDLASALTQMGAKIEFHNREGCLPLTVHAPVNLASEVRVGTSTSSQFISALLLISPSQKLPFKVHAEGEMVSTPYVRMTCGLLEMYGFSVHVDRNTYAVTKATAPSSLPLKLLWESDWSAAIYPLLINGLHTKWNIRANNLHSDSLQGDSKIEGILSELGLQLHFADNSTYSSSSGQLSEIVELDLENCPDLAQPIIAYLAAKNQRAHIKGLVTLQYKETNRIEAMGRELRKLGAHVNFDSTSFSIEKGIELDTSAEVSTYNDHRMAMSFFLLQLVAPGIRILAPQVVKKSFPEFWKAFESLGFKFERTNDAV